MKQCESKEDKATEQSRSNTSSDVISLKSIIAQKDKQIRKLKEENAELKQKNLYLQDGSLFL